MAASEPSLEVGTILGRWKSGRYMSILELPKITLLIAASACGVYEANGGWWRVVKNVWHRVPFVRLPSRVLHDVFPVSFLTN